MILTLSHHVFLLAYIQLCAWVEVFCSVLFKLSAMSFFTTKKKFCNSALSVHQWFKKCFVFFYIYLRSLQSTEVQPSIWNATHNSEILLFCSYFLNRLLTYYRIRIIETELEQALNWGL